MDIGSLPTTELSKCLLVLVLSAAIGWERELHGRPAGIRTHMLVALGTLLFCDAGRAFGGDPGRVASQVVTGIGFLGAGTILRLGGEIKGLTTAASVWATSAIAMSVGAGGWFTWIAIFSTVLALLTLTSVDLLVHRFIRTKRFHRLEVFATDRGALHEVVQLLGDSGVTVQGINVLSTTPVVQFELETDGVNARLLADLCNLGTVTSARWAD